MIRVVFTAVTGLLHKLARFTATGRIGEKIEDRELLQHYGFASRPKAGAEGVAIANGNAIVIVADEDRRYRIALENGEVSLYTDEGDKIHLKRNRVILIESNNVQLGGSAGLQKLIDERFALLYNTHTHVGVTVGAGVTGIPAITIGDVPITQVPLSTVATGKTKAV